MCVAMNKINWIFILLSTTVYVLPQFTIFPCDLCDSSVLHSEYESERMYKRRSRRRRKKNMKEFKFVIIIVTHHRTKIQLQNYIFITYLYLGLSFFKSIYTQYVWRPTLLVRECVRE